MKTETPINVNHLSMNGGKKRRSGQQSASNDRRSKRGGRVVSGRR